MWSAIRFVSLFVLVALPASAQPRGITGVVRDEQQAVVVGAQVILTSPQTATKATTLTDGTGLYGFLSLQPGVYVVEVHAKGFRVTPQAITLGTSEGETRDFVLALAGAAESVTVTATGGVDRGYRVDTVASLGP